MLVWQWNSLLIVIADSMEDIKQAPDTQGGQGAEARQVFDFCKDSECQGNKQDHPQIIRVGNDVLELITIPDTLGRPHTTLVGRTREVIKERSCDGL